MTALAFALTLVLFVGPAAALVSARLRPALALGLAATGVALAALAAAGAGSERTLAVTHAAAAYRGQEIASKAFVVDEVSAPAWQWPLLAAAWALAWALAAWLRASRTAPSARPLTAPLALAWGGSALLLALQKTAAPPALALGLDLPGVPPFEIALLPALLAAALRLARVCARALHLVLFLSLCVALAHLPLAIGGSVATHHQLGTFLDVHRIEYVAHPLTRAALPLAPGSREQLLWLIWLPQLVVWPALAMLSAGGAGFAAFLLSRYPDRSR